MTFCRSCDDFVCVMSRALSREAAERELKGKGKRGKVRASIPLLPSRGSVLATSTLFE